MLGKIKEHRGRIILLLILLLTAFLTLFKVWDEGFGNQYYTAAVKSMLTSWHNFFYVSFDTSGFISVDKPPLGLWLQCLFALLFGLHGWSVVLLEALCSLGSVCVLYSIVKKSWGETCALLAAFFMALTPIFIAVSRTNNMDPVLVLPCLLALWALMKAAEKGSLKYILLSMALIGIGFNIKMMQAYMFLPAIYLVYFFTAEVRMSKRIAHLAVATAVLVVISLSWCLIVDMTPAASRPFVGSSATNSELDLAIGYNGILRALPIKSEALQSLSGAISLVPNEGAKAGLLRFFNKEMAGQASWLLPMAFFGLIAFFMRLFKKDASENKKTERKKTLRQLLLWGGLFVPMYGYFSVSSHIHRYYLIMFTPVLAALSAIAVIEFLRRFKRNGETGKNQWQNILLPLSAAVTAAVQVYILKVHYARYSAVLVPVIIAASAAAILLFIVAKSLKKDHKILIGLALALSSIGLLAAPAYWSYTPIEFGTNVITPFAGPPRVSAPTDNGEPQTIMTNMWAVKWFEGADLDGTLIPNDAVDYMLAHDNGSKYLLAVPNVMYSAPIMLDHNISVMTIGGFVGTDKPLDIHQFIQKVQAGEIQYYYAMMGANTDIDMYVVAHGKKLDPKEYMKNSVMMQYFTIYDLTGLRTS